jgi:glyoxylase-like metal-dependent hydrolase (beta-lactamase superfamily II)
VDTSEGLVLIDTGSFLVAPNVHQRLRKWSQNKVHTVIFTHGHFDHVFGVDIYEKDANEVSKKEALRAYPIRMGGTFHEW